ncbi:hypothetical protein ARSEF1564_008806 [Beauveria bassiana]
MAADKPTSRADFRFAIICALPCEADAVTLLFDEFWDDDGDVFGRAKGDTNTYVTGRIGFHNMVLVTAPAMGTTNAASTATCLRLSFPEVKLALLIGVCGGMPKIDGRDVFLGDVVISRTLIQFDYGRQYPGHFTVKKTVDDSLGRANKEIRSLLANIEMEFGRMIKDRLYLPSYSHRHQSSCDSCRSESNPTCELATKASCEDLGCNDIYLVKRERPDDDGNEPALFIGRLGSGNTVMKSGEDRDRIAAEHGIIAFEMEGTGIWDEIPCIVVKAICDFSDSHKNKAWQDYAAATAAAVGRALLERCTREDDDANAVKSQEKLSREDGATATRGASSQPINVTFGNENSGFQAGFISGNVSNLKFGGK